MHCEFEGERNVLAAKIASLESLTKDQAARIVSLGEQVEKSYIQVQDSDFTETKKESLRKKSLGELGELYAIKTLVDHEFDRIRNTNDDHMNEKFADIICEKDKARFVVSVKSRNMYQLDGSLNTRYNLGRKVYEHARYAEEKYDAVACWMAIQFDENHYSVYFGSLESLGGSTGIPISKCQSGEVGTILVNRKRHYFDFEFYKNTRSRSCGKEGKRGTIPIFCQLIEIEQGATKRPAPSSI